MIRFVVRSITAALLLVVLFYSLRHAPKPQGAAHDSPVETQPAASHARPEHQLADSALRPSVASTRPAASPLRIELGKPHPDAPSIAAASTTAPSTAAQPSQTTLAEAAADQNSLRTKVMTLPLRFEPNRGQARDDSQFIARSGSYEIHFSPNRAELQMPGSSRETGKTISIGLEGADPHTHIEAAVPLVGKSNYLRQSDKSTWLTNIPNYKQLQYRQVYPGVDLVFYGNRGQLEYDFIVSPRTSTDSIALRIPKGSEASVTANGDLRISDDGAEVRLLKPEVYQFSGSGERQDVQGAYRIVADTSGSLVKFALGDYDRSKPLIIDPVLSYSTSASITGTLEGIAVDSTGNIYILSTYSVTSVTKLSSDGSTVLYNTTIGSSYSGSGTSIAVDSNGQAHTVGYTTIGYPTTATAYRPVSGSGYHIGYSVLSANGDALVYSTYILGSSTDYPQHVTLDSAGKAYITGTTYSSDYPNTGTVAFNGYSDGFLTKMDPTMSGGASLVYSDVIPAGYTYASAPSAAVDSSGAAYVAINNDQMPVTPGAYNFDGIYAYNGGSYISKYDPTGVLVYTAYLGYGTISDIAVDGSGSAYATGTPSYGDFPATAGAYQSVYPYGYVSKLDPTGATLVYSTFLSGPSGSVQPESIAVLPGCVSNCAAYIGGSTNATDFPAINAIQSESGGSSDAFIVNLSGNGASASFSTYLGGSVDEYGGQSTYAHVPQLRLDSSGNEYIAGNTDSPDFPYSSPTTPNSPYIVKISSASGAALLPSKYSVNFGTGTLGVPAQQSVILRNYGTATLTLNAPVATGDFTEADSCGGSIAPGSSCTVQLTFTGTLAGQRYGTLTITHSGVNSPTQIALTGYDYDQSYLTLSPQQLQFGGQTAGTSSSPQSFTVTNTGSQPANILGVNLSDGTNFAQSNNCPSELAKGNSCTVQVTFTPTTVGEFAPYVSISAYGGFNGNSYVLLYGTGTGVGTSSAVVSATSLNFPDAVVGATSTAQALTVTNTGTIPITMNGATINGDFTINSSGCTANVTVYPDSYCQINVNFMPSAAGTRTGTLTISSTATGFPQTVSLSGNGLTLASGIAVSPLSMQFPDQVQNTASSAQSITVTNTGSTVLSVDRVYSTTMDFIVTNSGCNIVTLSPLSTCTFSVEFKPTAAAALSGSIVLVDSDPTSPQTVTVSGNGLSPSATLEVTPETLAFDDTVAGTTSLLTVSLWNPGNSPVNISSITSDSTEFVVSNNGCITVSANNSCSFNVTFQPVTAGMKTSTVTIVNSGSGSPQTISMSGNSIAPVESVIPTPQAYMFLDQVVGTTSSSQGIYFYNSGTSPVTVSSASASGDFAANNSCYTISPGYYCYVSVTFTPTASGLRTGTLTLFDDAPGNPHTVALSGNGLSTTSTVEVSPSGTFFTDQVVGTTSSSQLIYFYNTGNSPVTITSLTASGDFAVSSTTCNTSVPANLYCYAYVTFTPTAAGSRTGALTMMDNAPGSPHGANLSGNGLAASESLTLSPGSLDFGNLVVSGTAGTQSAYLVNSGTEPVAITAITASANATASQGCVVNLAPGGSCQVSVGFTATAAGTQTGTVTITSNAAGSPQTIMLTANGVASTPSYSLVPNGLAFDQAVSMVPGITSQSVVFHNASGASVTVTSATTSGDFSVSTNNCNVVANGSQCGINVEFSPTSTGVRTGSLTLNLTPGGQIVANLAGYGEAATKVAEVTPTGLTFTDQVTGTASTASTVYVYDKGTQPITFSTVTVSGDFAISYNNCTGLVSSYCAVEVKYQPTTTGPETGVLTITDDSPTSPHTISLAGDGLAPTNTVVLNASELNYPDQPLNNASAGQSIYVTNTGNSPVHLNTPTITGDFSINYSSCPATLSPGGYCYEQMIFTPTVLGARTGALTITSDSSSGTQTVTLGGNGIAATRSLVVSTASMQFPNAPVGIASSDQYFYVYNNGSLPVTIQTPTITGDFSIPYNVCSTVAAGSYCYIYVQFTPTQSGTRTGMLTLTDNVATSPQQISLTGQGETVTKLARLSITGMEFASQAMGTTSTSQYVYLYNQGNVTLNISSIGITGDFATGYSSCGSPPTAISVNSYCYVYVSFTPTATGTRTGALTFTDDATNSPQVMTLTGTGTTPNASITASTSSMVFPPQELNSTSGAQYLYLTSNSNVPITFSTATIDNPEFSIYYTYCSSFSYPGQICYYAITFTPTATGTQTGTLTIPSNATGSPLKISLSGSGIPTGTGGQLSQTSITFPSQPLQITSAGVTVYYTNSGASNIVISSSIISGDFSKTTGCDTATIGIKSYCAFTVYFKPTQTGTRTGSIVITDNTTSSPRTIMLTGTGANTSPTVSLNPSALSFGNQLMGVASATQTVTLSNTGTAALTVSTVTITPATDFNITSDGCLSGVAAASYCYIYVSFNPSTTGLRSANLVITDSATGSPHMVGLSGTGIASAPIVALSSPNIAFGNYGVGATSSGSNITLYNNGNAALNITSIATSTQFGQTNNCGSTLAANTNCNIAATFTPSATGVQTGTLMITDNATGSPHQVNLSGTGLAPSAAQVTPSTIIFPNQAINTTSSNQNVEVVSTGASLTVNTATITGDFALTNGCTSTLGNNGYCLVGVTFTPTAVGNRTGTLTITDNSPTSPHVIALSGTGTGSPTVTLSLMSLNFNSVNVGTTSAQQPVTLTNTGNGPLGIGSIVASGDYAQTNNCGPNLNATIGCTINVTFTPTTYGNRSGAVTITDNATGSPQAVTLAGIGLAPGISANPPSVAFTPAQAVGSTSAAVPITVTNPGTVNLVVSSVTPSTQEFSQTNNCTTVAPNGTCTVNVKFSPLGAGTRSASLMISSNAPALQVPLSGTGTGPVAMLDKTSLSFGNVNVGSPSSTQTITLSSAGDTALTISSIVPSGDYSETNNCGGSIAVNSSCMIVVTFTPTAPGSRSGQITITDNAANSPQPVMLSGSGLGADVTFSPSSLNFSSVLVNTTSTAQSTIITNAGTTNLAFTSITTTGDFAQTNNCVSPLVPSGTCTANVTFTPTTTGTRSGSLNVNTSTGASSAGLSGIGITQGLEFSPGSVSFTPEPVGLTETQSLTVMDVGSSSVTISGVTASGDFGIATTNCTTLLPTNSCTITVTFTPSQQGTRTGTLSVTDDAPGSPQAVALTGMGTQPSADLALSGNASPKSGPPGDTATFTVIVTNNGPSSATSVMLSLSAPTNATLQSVTPSTGTCAGTAPIACVLGSLNSGASATVVMVVTNSTQGPMTTNAAATATENDPNVSNNSLTLTSDTSEADIQVVAASTATTLSGQPAFTMGVVNNGPSNATNVVATFDLDRFGYASSVASQGSCSWNGVQLVCALGPLSSGASASVTVAVQPPDSGWTSIEAHAYADQYDPMPTNNLAQITPTPDGYNTTLGTNVSVNTTDPQTGSTANLLFAAVTRPGITALAAANGAAPPAGYRAPRTNETFNATTSAQFNGTVTFTLRFAPSSLWHPTEARLFHAENGVWVDRTTALNPAGTIAAVTGSLSEFAIFEPPDQPPVANPGSAQVIAGTNASGNQVQLNGSLSTDPENDALTYKWTGPFPEGNGTATGVNPMVTMPLGASQVTLVVNDGEVDSPAVTQSVTVSDFAIAANMSAITLSRGQSANLAIALSPKFASYNRAVALECANLPADLTCQFAQPSVTPGANGSSVILTITASPTAALRTHDAPRFLATWFVSLGLPFGLILMTGGRKRRTVRLALLAMLLLVLYMAGCGGGGNSFQPQPPVSTGTTSTIGITGTSSGLQHSVAVTVTRN